MIRVRGRFPDRTGEILISPRYSKKPSAVVEYPYGQQSQEFPKYQPKLSPGKGFALTSESVQLGLQGLSNTVRHRHGS